jgi:hypothetical protein
MNDKTTTESIVREISPRARKKHASNEKIRVHIRRALQTHFLTHVCFFKIHQNDSIVL